MFNAPKIKGAAISIPDNKTLTYTCTQPGYVIKGTTSQSEALAVHCLVDALQLQAEGVECVCKYRVRALNVSVSTEGIECVCKYRLRALSVSVSTG